MLFFIVSTLWVCAYLISWLPVKTGPLEHWWTLPLVFSTIVSVAALFGWLSYRLMEKLEDMAYQRREQKRHTARGEF